MGRIILARSSVNAHVPAPHNIDGMMTALNNRSVWCRRKDLGVNSCLCLGKAAQATLILFFISVVPCCSSVIVCPKYFVLLFDGKISTLMSSICASFCLLDFWLERMFVLSV